MADGSSSPAYEQFCLLAKSQRGRAAVALIQQVLSKEKIYVFGELISMENIQALRDGEFAPYLRLLELFAYGTYSQYTADPSQYPELNKKMVFKLRQLSIVTLAHRSKKVSYEALQAELGLSNVRELEDLVIDTTYAGLLDGRLDQAKGVLNVRGAMTRDVRPEEVGGLIAKLSAWSGTMQSTLAALEGSMERVKAMREAEEAQRAAVQKGIEDTKRALERRAAKGLEDPEELDDVDGMDVEHQRPGRGLRALPAPFRKRFHGNPGQGRK